jgi:hypothetical protein
MLPALSRFLRFGGLHLSDWPGTRDEDVLAFCG